MKDARFEEREYEAPLYNQLERGSRLLWSPGQVFEQHIGIDRAMFTVNDLVFNLHGLHSHLAGAILSRFKWPASWPRGHGRGKLPSFHLNLFIQAKRPQWGSRAPKIVSSLGLTGRFWKFNLLEHQQMALHDVASRLGNRALVVYAAPVFHESEKLYKYTCLGNIVEHSTFPSALDLKDHNSWYYNCSGATGVASSEPQRIEGQNLFDRLEASIQQLRSGDINEIAWETNIRDLADGITTALSGDDQVESPMNAHFFDRQREIDRELDGNPMREVLKDFITIMNFIELYSLSWLTIDSCD